VPYRRLYTRSLGMNDASSHEIFEKQENKVLEVCFECLKKSVSENNFGEFDCTYDQKYDRCTNCIDQNCDCIRLWVLFRCCDMGKGQDSYSRLNNGVLQQKLPGVIVSDTAHDFRNLKNVGGYIVIGGQWLHPMRTPATLYFDSNVEISGPIKKTRVKVAALRSRDRMQNYHLVAYCTKQFDSALPPNDTFVSHRLFPDIVKRTSASFGDINSMKVFGNTIFITSLQCCNVFAIEPSIGVKCHKFPKYNANFLSDIDSEVKPSCLDYFGHPEIGRILLVGNENGMPLVTGFCVEKIIKRAWGSNGKVGTFQKAPKVLCCFSGVSDSIKNVTSMACQDHDTSVWLFVASECRVFLFLHKKKKLKLKAGEICELNFKCLNKFDSFGPRIQSIAFFQENLYVAHDFVVKQPTNGTFSILNVKSGERENFAYPSGSSVTVWRENILISSMYDNRIDFFDSSKKTFELFCGNKGDEGIITHGVLDSTSLGHPKCLDTSGHTIFFAQGNMKNPIITFISQPLPNLRRLYQIFRNGLVRSGVWVPGEARQPKSWSTISDELAEEQSFFEEMEEENRKILGKVGHQSTMGIFSRESRASRKLWKNSFEILEKEVLNFFEEIESVGLCASGSVFSTQRNCPPLENFSSLENFLLKRIQNLSPDFHEHQHKNLENFYHHRIVKHRGKHRAFWFLESLNVSLVSTLRLEGMYSPVRRMSSGAANSTSTSGTNYQATYPRIFSDFYSWNTDIHSDKQNELWSVPPASHPYPENFYHVRKPTPRFSVKFRDNFSERCDGYTREDMSVGSHFANQIGHPTKQKNCRSFHIDNPHTKPETLFFTPEIDMNQGTIPLLVGSDLTQDAYMIAYYKDKSFIAQYVKSANSNIYIRKFQRSGLRKFRCIPQKKNLKCNLLDFRYEIIEVSQRPGGTIEITPKVWEQVYGLSVSDMAPRLFESEEYEETPSKRKRNFEETSLRKKARI
jgi:hypothetical protein